MSVKTCEWDQVSISLCDDSKRVIISQVESGVGAAVSMPVHQLMAICNYLEDELESWNAESTKS